MSKNDGGPAKEKSLRDHFAGQIAPKMYEFEMRVFGPRRIGELLNGMKATADDDVHWADRVAHDSYRLADALLAEREKETENAGT